MPNLTFLGGLEMLVLMVLIFRLAPLYVDDVILFLVSSITLVSLISTSSCLGTPHIKQQSMGKTYTFLTV